MKPSEKKQAVAYVKGELEKARNSVARLTADLQELHEVGDDETPTWHALVASAWASEGEDSWSGDIKAKDLEEAVYTAMLNFCKHVGRVYPGHKGSTGKVYTQFDVQGTIYLNMVLPNGTLVPADHAKVDRLKGKFNQYAPLPVTKRRKPVGIS